MYKIISKRIDRQSKKYVFSIQIGETTFNRFAEEISEDKTLLASLDKEDIFDIAFTQGSESVLKEMKLIKDFRKTES